MIIIADTSDVSQLTEIALKSKAVWGYSKELIESWKEDLTVTSKMIEGQKVFKFLQNDKIIGFYILNQPIHNSIELEFLFVLPKVIGKGIGKQLLMHAVEEAKLQKVKKMNLLADPNAVSFYEKHGFVIIDKKESAIAGRFLPVLEKDLEQ
jgi:N-acetylglutamate synthase-like GNAT family acetyltransferase